MLIVGGHNPAGNVIHLIYGPETELFMDIHGAKVADITSVVEACKQGEQIFISLSRCKSEAYTDATMRATGVSFTSSFTGAAVCDKPSNPVAAGVQNNAGQQVTHNDTKAPQAGVPPNLVGAIPVKQGVCTYCHRSLTLMPVEAMQICGECLAIEVGRLREKDKQELTDMGDAEQGAVAEE